MKKTWNWAHALSVLSLSCIPLFSAAAQANQCEPDAIAELELVGETRLSVMFWDVYDARLYTDTGEYEGAGQRALRLDYLRDIEAADLVETTEEEWEKLDYEIDEQAQTWLADLDEMWPDVKEGDCLTLVETEDGFARFYNADGELGVIESKQFTQQFLDIWLSAESRFDDERNELIGEK